jgi:glycosyltransferase involved in cell wall biosynthesis
MRILIVSQYYYPEQFRINDIAERLVKEGNDVTVVTGIPNYPKGNFFDGYGYFKKRTEVLNGVKIRRSFIIPRGTTKLQLFLNYISFVFGGFLTLLKVGKKTDVIFTYQVSPMFQVIPAIWYGKINQIPNVVYITDLWPESVEYIGGVKNKVVLKFLTRVSRFIYNNSSKILISSRGFDSSIYAISKATNLEYLPIYSESAYLKKGYQVDSNNVFSFVFAGNIGDAQGLEQIVYGVSRLDIGLQNFEVRVIGDGRKRKFVEKLVNDIELTKVFKFYGRRSMEETIELVTSSNVALISLKSNPINKLTLPSKTQSLLAMAMPILVIGEGAVAEVIKEANCGLTAAPENYHEISEIILNFIAMDRGTLQKMSKNSLNFYKKNYTEEKFHNRLNQVLVEVMEKNNGN